MGNFPLYYFVPWPFSQKWLYEDNLVEDGIVVSLDNGACIISKEYYEAQNQ